MSNEKFKVKFGLAVGDTAATVDGTTGDIVTNGDIDVKGSNVTNSTGALILTSTGANNVQIDPGSGTTTNDGHMVLGQFNTNAILSTNGTGALDIRTGTFPTSANINLASGTNGNITVDTDGTGQVIINADVDINGNLVTNGITGGNVTVGVATDQTISTTTGDLLVTTAAGNSMYLTTDSTNPIFAVRNTTNTTDSARALTLRADSTGTPAVGFGTLLDFEVENSTGGFPRAGYVGVYATNVTATSENFKMGFGLMKNGAFYAEKMMLDSDGNLQIDGDLTVSGGNISTNILNNRIQIDRTTDTTNQARVALLLQTETTGTPAVGMGTALSFSSQLPDLTFKEAGYIAVNSTDVTAGSEDFQMRFGLMENGQQNNDKFVIDSAGNTIVVGGQRVNETLSAGGKVINSQGNILVQKVGGMGSQSPAAAFFDNTSGSRKGTVVIREYGQSTGVSPQTGTGTLGQSGLILEGSRGTGASPLANNGNNNTVGTIGSGGYDGNRWLSETGLGQPNVIAFQNTEPYQSETTAFTGYITGTTLTVTAVSSGTLAPGQLLSAEAWTSTGSTITGTTLTIGTLTAGSIQLNQPITGTGVLPNTYIVSGSGSTWTVSQNHVNPVTATNINGNITISTVITAFGADTSGGVGTYTVSINANAGSSGTPLSFTSVGTSAAGSRVVFVSTPTGVKLSTASRQSWFVNGQSAPSTTTINGVSIANASSANYLLGNIDGTGNVQLVSTDGTKIYQGRGSQNLQFAGGSINQTGITSEDLAQFQGFISGNTLTVTSVSSGIISLGALVNATGIAQGTFISNTTSSSISSTLLQTTTANASSGSTTITVASATGFTPGLYVTGTGIPSNTTITDVNGLNITLSAATTAPLSTTTVSLYAANWTITSSYATAGQTIGSSGSPVNMVTTPDNNAARGTNGVNLTTTRKSPIGGRFSALRKNDNMTILNFNGSNGSSVGGSTSIAGQIRFQAAEDFTPSAAGSIFHVSTNNIGTTSNANRLRLDSNTLLLSTATKNWSMNESGTTSFPSYTFPYADGSANQVLTTNGAGLLSWVTGGGGNPFNQDLNTYDAVTFTGLTSYAGIQNFGAWDNNTVLAVTGNLPTTKSSSGGRITFQTNYKVNQSDVAYVVPQAGYQLGTFNWQSYKTTAGGSDVLGGGMYMNARENWTGFNSTGSSISGTTLTIGTLVNGAITVGQGIYGTGIAADTVITGNISGSGSGSTWTINNSYTVGPQDIGGGQNGTGYLFQSVKEGYPWQSGGIVAMTVSPTATQFNSDQVSFFNAPVVGSATNYLTLNSAKAQFNLPVRQNITTASVTEGGTYTPAATAQNAISLTINTGSGTTVIDLANLTGQGDGGMYTIMVFNNAASGTPIQVKNTRINTNNLMTHTIGTGDRIMITAYIVGNYATAEHLVVA